MVAAPYPFFTMKTTFTFVAWVVALAGSVTAGPVTFNEISLLVRMHDTDAYMIQQLTQRRLLHALTPGQEAALKAQGASDALLQALRKPDVVFSAEEAAAFEKWSEQQRQAIEQRLAEEAAHREAVLARQAALAAQQLEETRARAAADAAFAAAAAATNYSPAYDYGYAPYYGGYYDGSIGSPSGCINRPAWQSFSASGLHWQNGNATIYTKPGLFYYPLGNNGSSSSSINARPTRGVNAGTSKGGGAGIRFGR